MKLFHGRQWIEVFRPVPEGVECLVCHQTFAYITSNYQCPHCKVNLNDVAVGVNMATIYRNDALFSIPVIALCAFGAWYAIDDGLAGHWAGWNAIIATMNLAAGWLNIRVSRKNWKRWRTIRPLYQRLKAEQHPK